LLGGLLAVGRRVLARLPGFVVGACWIWLGSGWNRHRRRRSSTPRSRSPGTGSAPIPALQRGAVNCRGQTRRLGPGRCAVHRATASRWAGISLVRSTSSTGRSSFSGRWRCGVFSRDASDVNAILVAVNRSVPAAMSWAIRSRTPFRAGYARSSHGGRVRDASPLRMGRDRPPSVGRGRNACCRWPAHRLATVWCGSPPGRPRNRGPARVRGATVSVRRRRRVSRRQCVREGPPDPFEVAGHFQGCQARVEGPRSRADRGTTRATTRRRPGRLSRRARDDEDRLRGGVGCLGRFESVVVPGR
jgi:hypothetical protein